MNFEEDYYQQVYKNYNLQNPDHKYRFYLSLIEKFRPKVSKPDLLELGCAFGKFVNFLPKNWNIYGLDPSNFAINKARQIAPHANLAVASLPNIPFKENFDIITAFDVLEHIPSLKKTIHNIKKKSAPAGIFLFVVPVYDGPTGPIIRLLDRDPSHVHKKSRRFWLNFIEKEFEILDWIGIYRYLVGRYYIHIPTKTMRNFTAAIAVVAKNKTW